MAQKRKKSGDRERRSPFDGPDHDPRIGVPDTGDVIDPDAEDPDPPEITDRADPSFVDPAEVE